MVSKWSGHHAHNMETTIFEGIPHGSFLYFFDSWKNGMDCLAAALMNTITGFLLEDDEVDVDPFAWATSVWMIYTDCFHQRLVTFDSHHRIFSCSWTLLLVLACNQSTAVRICFEHLQQVVVVENAGASLAINGER